MIKLIVGVKGTGKTKALVDEINKAANESHGSVVCVEYKRKLTYDINYRVRLADAGDYGVNDADKLYGFVCGILAGNYDVTELFIDSALKICGDDVAAFERFFLALNEITEKNNIHCVMTASLPAEDVPASLASFIRDAH
ncbi:MAG: hypothetical protein ACI3ZE_08015 [Candidatus Woodwardiibium sp.]|jgi:hypothetical protein|nr:MAG: hypothetical protein DBY40_03595 [Clostridiales bacterium]